MFAHIIMNIMQQSSDPHHYISQNFIHFGIILNKMKIVGFKK